MDRHEREHDETLDRADAELLVAIERIRLARERLAAADHKYKAYAKGPRK